MRYDTYETHTYKAFQNIQYPPRLPPHPEFNPPTPTPSPPQVSRADILLGGLATGAAALAGGLALPSLAFAAEEGAAAAAPADLGPAPTNFGLSKEYYKDASQMLQHMKCVGVVVGWVLLGGGGGPGPMDWVFVLVGVFAQSPTTSPTPHNATHRLGTRPS